MPRKLPREKCKIPRSQGHKERINKLYSRPDSFYLYLAINKMTYKIKEIFTPSHNRSTVLSYLNSLKNILKHRDATREKYQDTTDKGKSKIQEEQVNSELDEFEQWLDLATWPELCDINIEQNSLPHTEDLNHIDLSCHENFISQNEPSTSTINKFSSS